ncbi:GGDEF domain-containing protein [Oceanidesulfovibrio indonesiensis]|uniref:diguanylate cyclase n=1 Tax=Oceanidesulfovibrio indonesiensis TaxID=54767 RepID=A0A7M3MFP3_9BACT|nr:diguanylate cyclase [Oceanidesulfovibrio indonesiensis]TVM17935.1 GGDEF domain-containing protein [Oceanidesulfovibrio indonesiensis]
MLHLATFSARLRAFMLLLGLLPVVLGIIGFSLFSRDRIIADAHGRIAETIGFQKRLVEDWFHEQSNNMDFLARQYVVRRQDEDGITALFLDFMATHPEVSGLVYVGPDGLTRVDPGNETGIDISDREYFLAARQGKKHVSEVLIGRQSGKALVIISSPVKDIGGRFGGVVFTVLPVNTLDSWLEDLRPGPHGESFLIGEGNVLLTDMGRQSELSRLDRIAGEALGAMVRAAENGKPYTGIRGGKTVVGATTTLKDGNWRIISEMPLEAVLSGVVGYTRLFALACLAALLIVAPAGWLLVRTMVRPLHMLSGYARDVREGWVDDACPYLDRGAPKEIIDLHGAFCSMVHRLEENTETLRRVAVTDQLTGLANRRRLEEEGIRLVDACIRAGTPCAALLIDIDHFKQVNDTYGHAMGDHALEHVARIIEGCCRGSDLPARYGGEEFAVIAPNADAAQARTLAERIRRTVEQSPVDNDGMPLELTVSVGVAQYSKAHGRGLSRLEDVLGKADSALYNAKESGRNRVCLFPQPDGA